MTKDFTGFSFDGVHSSYLNIHRVSDGNYYEDILQPNFENKLNPIPGKDGQYYFGADYTEKEINIKIAFDSVTEMQLRQIVNLFSTKKICSLIFDERPYKMYNVRLASPITLSYVCFDEQLKVLDTERDGVRVKSREVVPVTEEIENPETGEIEEITTYKTVIQREQVTPYKYVYNNNEPVKQRIYKGEGEINVICVSPMAKAPFKTLQDYETPRLAYDVLTEAVESNLTTSYTNVSEWAAASGILDKAVYQEYKMDIPQYKTDTSHTSYNVWINVYNPGDKDSPFILFLPYYHETSMDTYGHFESPESSGVVRLYTNESETMEIAPFTAVAPYTEENGVIINSNNHLIEGVYYNQDHHTFSKTGNLYNDKIIAGDFSYIVKQDIFANVKNNDSTWKQSVLVNYNLGDNAEDDVSKIRIMYDYLYY